MPDSMAHLTSVVCHEGDTLERLQQHASPSLIEPGLYLGSITAEQEPDVLQALGITHILSLTTGFTPTAPQVWFYSYRTTGQSMAGY